MFLSKIKVINFKNCREEKITFSDKINCFVGCNGAGKTNLLDAIYYLSFTKSYFNFSDQQNICHGQEFFAIHGTFIKDDATPDEISCIQKQNTKKQLKINQKEYDKISEHIGRFPCVMVSPYDRDLINEGSDVRRKFIDTVISQFDKIYLSDLIKYNKFIEQRNSLLKKFGHFQQQDYSFLQLIDEQVAPIAEKIHQKRKSFIHDFEPIFEKHFNFISGGNENVEIEYESQLNIDTYLQTVKKQYKKDLDLRYSTVGVHKDDFIFKMDGYPIKKYGSQGQQKSFAVALKLAQFEFTRNILKYNPLLLLDDIFDKLDAQRVQKLIALVSGTDFGQIFITDTETQRTRQTFEHININYKIFEISKGKILK